MLPKGLTSIGSSAFQNCTGLVSITLPEGLEEIKDSAFYGCKELSSITLPEGLEKIGDYAFSGCKNLKEVTIPSTVEVVGTSSRGRVFSDCTGLTKVIIRDGVKELMPYAFYGCKKLTEIEIPVSVEEIGANAFSGCAELRTVEIKSEKVSIGAGAFQGLKKLEKVTVENKVTSIGSLAFDGCEELSEIVLPKGLTSIGYRAFENCTGLVSITLPEGLEEIRDSAFSGCEKLSSITLPEGLEKIGDRAFSGCKCLKEVTIPSTVEVVGTSYTGSVFSACTELTTVVLNEGTVELKKWLFSNCTNLTQILLPSSIQKIEPDVFNNCSENLVCYIKKGTYAEEYVIANGLSYVYYDETLPEFAQPKEKPSGTPRPTPTQVPVITKTPEDISTPIPTQMPAESKPNVAFSGIAEGQKLEVGDSVVFTITSDRKLTEAYFMFDRPAGWSAESGAVYFGEENCKKLYSVDVTKYTLNNGVYQYSLTWPFDTMGNAADAFRRYIKLAYKAADNTVSYTEEVVFHVYPALTAAVASNGDYLVNSEYVFTFVSAVEYSNPKLYFDNALAGNKNAWLSTAFTLEKAKQADGLYRYTFTKVFDTVGVADATGQHVRKYRLMDGITEITEGSFVVNPVVTEPVISQIPEPVPTPAEQEVFVTASWTGDVKQINGKLICEAGGLVGINIDLQSNQKLQDFSVEIYDVHGELVLRVDSEAFKEVNSSADSVKLNNLSYIIYDEACTDILKIIYKDVNGVEIAAWTDLLYVQNKDTVDEELLTELKSFQGVCVKNFVESN